MMRPKASYDHAPGGGGVSDGTGVGVIAGVWVMILPTESNWITVVPVAVGGRLAVGVRVAVREAVAVAVADGV
jgi:hypothetical protein